MSKLALGTAQFTMSYGVANRRNFIPLDELYLILEEAYRNNIRLIDTSPLYGNTEAVLGEICSTKNLSFSIISKLPFINHLSDIDFLILSTLKNLKLKVLEGYLIHHFSLFLEKPNIWNYLLFFKKKGLIKKLGFSIYHPYEWQEITKRDIIPDLIQIPLSIFDQRFMEFIPEMISLGVEIHVRSVFLQGLIFLSPDNFPSDFNILRSKLSDLIDISLENNLTLLELFLGFAITTPGISKVIVGIDSLSQFKEILSALSKVRAVSYLRNDLQKYQIEREDLIVPYLWPQDLVKT